MLTLKIDKIKDKKTPNRYKWCPSQVFFFNQTYVVETLHHFGILEFSEEEIQVCSRIRKS